MFYSCKCFYFVQWYTDKRAKQEPDESAAAAVTSSSEAGIPAGLPTMIPAPASYRAAVQQPQFVYSSLPQPQPAHANGPSPLPAHQGEVKAAHNGSTSAVPPPPVEYSTIPHNMSTSGAPGAQLYNSSLGKYIGRSR